MIRIFTPQELEMMDISVADRYYSETHMPLAVFDHFFTVEECHDFRRAISTFECDARYFGKNKSRALVSLEPLVLNPNSHNFGRTLADPQFARFVIMGEPAGSSIEIPFSRRVKRANTAQLK